MVMADTGTDIGVFFFFFFFVTLFSMLMLALLVECTMYNRKNTCRLQNHKVYPIDQHR